MPNDHSDLIRCLQMLSSDYAEWVHGQVMGERMMRSDAEAWVQRSHLDAWRTIGIKLSATDSVAHEFVDRVEVSITRPYQWFDALNAARRLAPSFLRRLEKERDAEQDQAKRDPVGTARREYVRKHADANPWLEDANVCLDGLPEVPKTQVRINPMDGSVITEF